MKAPTPQDLAQHLTASAGVKDRFGSNAEDVLEVARLVPAANDAWDKSTITAFQQPQKIHEKVWGKLKAIAHSQNLKNLPLEDLPASYTSLYALVVMKDEELQAAVADGLLKSKDLSTRLILDWTKAYRLRSTGIEQQLPLMLVLREELNEERQQALLFALRQVAGEFGADIQEGIGGVKQAAVKAEARAALALRIEEDLMREIGPVVLNAPEDLKRQFAVSSASDLIGGTRANFTGFFINLVGKKDELFWRNYGHCYCLKIARDFNLTESRAERFQFKKRITDAIKKWGGTINGFTEMAEGVLKTYMR